MTTLAFFSFLAQAADTSDDAGGAATAAGGAIGGIIGLAVAAIMIISMWKIFTKAGEPGWASIIPIYNTIVMLKIAGKPWWWLLLMFIPFVNFIIIIMAIIALAQSFGKGVGFGLGMLILPFIFFPLLAFGDAQHIGGGARPQIG
jgi:hypothetical protein